MSVTIEQARAFLEGRESQRRQDGERRGALLRARLPAIVEMLRSRHAVSSVRLFGSLAAGTTHAFSDIDLAVEGLAPDQYFDALADLMQLARCPVDLVRLETAPGSLRERILAEGELL